MKLAVLFLFIFVSMSHQQQLQQRMMWMPPYDAALNYQNNQNYYNKYYSYFSGQQEDPNIVAFKSPASPAEYKEEEFAYQPTPVMSRYRPSYPSYYSSPSPHQWFVAVSGNARYRNNIGGYPFANQYQSNPGFGYVFSHPEFDDQGASSIESDDSWMSNLGIESRRVARPPAPHPAPLLGPTLIPIENRLFFPSMGIQIISNTSQYRPFAKTVGVVTTQTVNITSVVTCIASNQFTIGFTTCARRKRAAIERFRLPDEDEDSIHPSTVLKIESTASPEQEMMEERNARLNELIASSKDDLILFDSEEELINREKDTRLSNDGRGRDKRFFFYTSTTTLTSYIFTTTIAFKKITLLSTVQSSSLICIPSGFVVCTF